MVEAISMTAQKAPRIILVEDEPLLVKLFEFSLAEWFKQTELMKFRNGDDAWQQLSQADPDLLIMDWSHPGLEGEAIMERLAQKKVGFPILLTSDYFEEHLANYAELGLKVVFLPKPFGLKQFWSALGQLVGPGDFPGRMSQLDD
jgi:CheY-like chemotaxis protein